MTQLNLEIRHGDVFRTARDTHPIERPDGFGDDEYEAHARSAADLVAGVLSGQALRTTGVIMMVVEEGLISEDEIQEQFLKASDQFHRAQTWRDAHVVEPIIPEVTV